MAESVIGTQTTATNKWTGKTSRAYLFDNMTILYKLPENSPANPTLNLTLFNGTKTGAIPIVSDVYSTFDKDDEVFLTYSSTRNNTSAWYTDDVYSVPDLTSPSYCWTDGATSSKTCDDSSITVRSGATYTIKFVNRNTAVRALTLNINGTGAKPIYINSIPSSGTNYSIPAGTYNVYYSGTYYNVMASTADKVAGVGLFKRFIISSANATTFTIQNNYRGVFWIVDETTNGSGEYIVASTSAGKAVVTTVKTANGVTFNTSTNGKLTVTLSSGSRYLEIMTITDTATIYA